MTDTLTVVGNAATAPETTTVASGKQLTTFRLASRERRYDRDSGTWVDGETNWYTVRAWGRLGAHAAASIHKGQQVIVLGRLRIEQWESGDRRGTSIDLDAQALGPSLQFGTARFERDHAGTRDDGAARGHMTVEAARADADDAAELPTSAAQPVDAEGWALPAEEPVPF